MVWFTTRWNDVTIAGTWLNTIFTDMVGVACVARREGLVLIVKKK